MLAKLVHFSVYSYKKEEKFMLRKKKMLILCLVNVTLPILVIEFIKNNIFLAFILLTPSGIIAGGVLLWMYTRKIIIH